jgi:hypothetical protein
MQPSNSSLSVAEPKGGGCGEDLNFNNVYVTNFRVAPQQYTQLEQECINLVDASIEQLTISASTKWWRFWGSPEFAQVDPDAAM